MSANTDARYETDQCPNWDQDKPPTEDQEAIKVPCGSVSWIISSGSLSLLRQGRQDFLECLGFDWLDQVNVEARVV